MFFWFCIYVKPQSFHVRKVTVLSKSNENELRRILPIVLVKYRQTFAEISERLFH